MAVIREPSPLQQGVETLGHRRKWAVAALRAFMVVVAITIILDLLRIFGSALLTSEIQDLAAVVYACALLVCLLLVSMWIHRAHANLQLSGLPDLEFTPGWAIGWYLVPIANLYKPFQAMRELFRSSLPHAESAGLLVTWWSFWIAGTVIGALSVLLIMAPVISFNSFEDLAIVASSATDIGAAWCLIGLIDQITKGQKNNRLLVDVFA